MTYHGYTISPRTNLATLSRSTVYDIFDGDKPVKRGFGAVEVAKHYIDAVLQNVQEESTHT